MIGRSDREVYDIRSSSFSMGELIEREKFKLEKLELELARTMDYSTLLDRISPMRKEYIVSSWPRVGIMTMTTAQTVYPASSRLSIGRRLSKQKIYPDYTSLAITQQDGHTIMPTLICLTTPTPEKLQAHNVSPERLSLLISLQVT